MDWTQIGIAIFIPLFVSLIAWTLTYIIPYVSPNWISNRIIWFTRDDPKDPIEIGLIINQFSKYDDWKRLTACKRMKKMFIEKVMEIDDINEMKWSELRNNVRNMPLNHILGKLDMLLMDLKDKKTENSKLLPEYTRTYFKEHKMNILEEKQKEYTKICKNHQNAKIWWEYTITSREEEYYNRNNSILTLEEIDVLLDLKYAKIDKEGTMSIEQFLKLNNHRKPERQTNEEILTTFNDVILYIDYPHSKSKKDELTYRLALGLSDHEKSHETLRSVIGEVKGQILMKDYNELRKRAGI